MNKLNLLPLLFMLLVNPVLPQTEVTPTATQDTSNEYMANPEPVYVTPTTTNVTTSDLITNDNGTEYINVCPSPNNYSLTAGYRLAGISPSCQAVQIPMYEINEVPLQ